MLLQKLDLQLGIWSDVINNPRKSRFIQIMDDLFWQPISYENEGKRTEFLIDSDMTHWIQRGRATDIQDKDKYRNIYGCK